MPGSGGPAVLTAMEPGESLEIAKLAAGKDYLAAGKDYLEIGTAAGFSAITAAAAGAWVTAVDYWLPDESNEQGNGTDYETFLRNLYAHGVRGRVRVFREDSAQSLTWLRSQGRSYDVVLIDGRHDEDQVARDITGALPLLVRGGVLACHDYDTEHPGVVAALARIFPTGPDRTVQSLWIRTV